MNINELIEALQSAADRGITKVECHFQQNYPLKGTLANARMLDGKMTIAVGTGGEYGDAKAWDDAEESECCECGDPLIDEESELCEDCLEEVTA